MERKISILGKDLLIEEAVIIGLSILGIVATFMPYIIISMGMLSNSHSLIKIGDGFIYILIYFACIILTITKKSIFSGVGGVILILLMIIQYVGIDEEQKVLSSFGFGFFLTLFAVVGIIGCSLLAYLRNKNGSESIEKGFSDIAKKTKIVADTVKTKAVEVNSNLNSKNVVTCTKCSKKYANDMNFCPDCGTPKPKEPTKIKCSNCATEINKDTKFCPTCGEKIQLHKVELKTCKSCGKPLDEVAEFCGSCGTKVEA